MNSLTLRVLGESDLVLGGDGGGVYPRTPLAFDSFTGTDGTTLAAHTPERGGPWIADREAFQIFANKAVASDAPGVFHIASLDVDAEDVSVSVGLWIDGAASLGVVARLVDADNYVFGVVNAVSQLEIFEVAGGVLTQKVRVVLPPTPSGTMVLTLVGTDATLEYGGATATATLSAPTTGGTRCGLFAVYENGTQTFDDFIVPAP